jgi:hypothetical protein
MVPATSPAASSATISRTLTAHLVTVEATEERATPRRTAARPSADCAVADYVEPNIPTPGHRRAEQSRERALEPADEGT